MQPVLDASCVRCHDGSEAKPDLRSRPPVHPRAGSDTYNQGLSERRANSVSSYLKGQGVMGQRIITLGMGESRPVADNSSEAGRQANRRVEITMVPVTAG